MVMETGEAGLSRFVVIEFRDREPYGCGAFDIKLDEEGGTFRGDA
jgi:hypothetical protein